MEAPLHKFTGSAAKMLVPDTDCDFRGLFCVSKSDLFWQHKRTLKNIRQEVLFLRLSGIKALAPESTSTHEKNSSNSSQAIRRLEVDANKSSRPSFSFFKFVHFLNQRYPRASRVCASDAARVFRAACVRRTFLC